MCYKLGVFDISIPVRYPAAGLLTESDPINILVNDSISDSTSSPVIFCTLGFEVAY